MANALYDLGRQKFLEGGIAWLTDDIKVVLVRGYSFLNSHEFLSDVTGGGGGTIVATSANLGAKSSTIGVADAGDVTFTAVGAGAACDCVIIYKDTGSAATSPLIAYINVATGLPVTPSGGDIVVVWDSGSNKIFKL